MPHSDIEKLKAWKSQYYKKNKSRISLRNKEYYKKRREHRLKWQKEYYQSHKEQDKIWRKEYNQKNKLKFKDFLLRKNYGLTIQQFDLMREGQQQRCAICRMKLEGPKNCCVDHDHSTNKVRGLLCGNCNLGLGKFKDSILIIESALNYLKRHG